MSRRSCMIRVLSAPVRILLIRLGPGWRGGTAGAGWDGGRGAEPLTDGRGAVLVVPGWGAAGSGMTLFPSASGERCRVPATAAIVAGTRQAQGLRGADVIGGESIHRVTAAGRQAPGQGPWPGEPTSGSYSFRRTMRLGDHGRLPPVTPGHLGRRGRLIPVSSVSLHSQLKTSNLFPEIMTGY